MHDEQLLSRMLSRAAHPVRVRSPKNPDRITNPKGAMIALFAKHGRRYVDATLGREFAQSLTGLSRLRKCKTFRRFEQKLTGR